jgi:hypothetical protein
MDLKIINSNDDNVVASNVSNLDSFFWLNCKNWLQKQTSYVIFSIRCCDCTQNKICHIADLSNKHWMNQSSLCRYGPILQEFLFLFFYKFFLLLFSCPKNRDLCLGHNILFFKDPMKKKCCTPTNLIHFHTFIKRFKKSKNHLCKWDLDLDLQWLNLSQIVL